MLLMATMQEPSMIWLKSCSHCLQVVGEGRCPIVDTWWQTETGMAMMAPLPGAWPVIPGSATLPFFGVVPVIVDEKVSERSVAVSYPSANVSIFMMTVVYGCVAFSGALMLGQVCACNIFVVCCEVLYIWPHLTCRRLGPQGNELQGACEGVLCLRQAWPSTIRTVKGDHKRFENTYFSTFKACPWLLILWYVEMGSGPATSASS